MSEEKNSLNYEVTEIQGIRSGKAIYMIMTVLLTDSGETVYVFGEEICCAVTSKDCIRNRGIDYNEVLLYENPFEKTMPEDAGKWRPLIEEFVYEMVPFYIERQDAARVFPQWVPEQG